MNTHTLMGLLAALMLMVSGCGQEPSATPASAEPEPAPVATTVTAPSTAPDYVGAAQCGQCHQTEWAQWQGSHHDLAIQEANGESIIGDFNQATFTHQGITSTFTHDEHGYHVHTDGPDGTMQSFPIAYAFGVYPLQQYLIDIGGGRLQALGIAWDSRAKDAGGQRWYHLYPNEPLQAGDRLHWTGTDQNWNFMCAECHSTQLQKGYDASTDTFTTTFQALDVACEACHGPGSHHVRWAQAEPAARWPGNGLVAQLDERANVQWQQHPTTGQPVRSQPRTTEREIDTCARCHSRRGILNEDVTPGQPIGQTHRIALLDDGLYHPDGQPNDENYVYGSFIQSRMHQAGVTCSDCHNPHSLALKLPGDQVCSQCHDANHYAQTRHHLHAPDSEGASCVSCHMPVTRFMGVDDRHDHSFRIPRPDQSAALGTPHACAQCHADQTAQWAAEHIARHHPQPNPGLQTYGPTLHHARQGNPAVQPDLHALARDQQAPAIARATAVSLLPRFPTQASLDGLIRATRDRNPLVRRAAAEGLRSADPALMARTLFPLLSDPIRDVRQSAAVSLASIDPIRYLKPAQRSTLQTALDDYIATQHLNADRADAWFNLGTLYEQQSDLNAAQQAYGTALEKDPTFTPAAINLANLIEAQQSPAAAVTLLQQQLARTPDAAAVHHALGLTHIRQQQYDAALAALTQAVAAEPDNARYTYVLAVMQFNLNQPQAGFALLERNLEQHPYDLDSLNAMVSYAQAQQDTARFHRFLPRLQAFSASP